MKHSLIFLIAILWSVTGFSQHFTSAHAGTNAEAYMSIYVFSGQIGGVNMQAGDEIGIFDGSICVGSKALTGVLSSTVSIKAAKSDAGSANGYLSGHSISAKVWDSSADKEYPATVVFHSGSPYSVFTDNESAYVDLSASQSLTINLIAENKVYDGSDNATVDYSVSGGVVSGDVTITATNGKFDTKNVGTGKTVTGTLTVSGADAGNYTFTKVETTTANITALPITITADAKSKTYGGTDPAFTAQVTSGSVITGDLASGSLTRVAGTVVNTYAINKGTYTYGSNYTETFVSANLTIIAKPISVKPYAQSKSYGSSDPAFTYQSVPTLLSGDSFTGTLTRSTGEAIGNYNYAIGSLSAGSNYSLSLDAGHVFTITTKTLNLSGLSVDSKVYNGNTSATLSGVASLSDIVGSESVILSGTPSASFVSANAGNSIEVNVTGLSLSGANSGNYTLNNFKLYGDITPKELTISGAVAQNKVYDGTTVATLTGASLVGKVGSDDVSLLNSYVGVFAQKDAGTNIGVSTSAMSLTGANADNYSLILPTGLKASITKKVLNITAKNQSKCFGSNLSLPGTDFTAETLILGDAISSVSLISDGAVNTASAGIYDIIPSNAVGTGLVNYTTNYINGKLNVEALPVPAITSSIPATQQPIQIDYTTDAGMNNYVWTISSGGVIATGAGTNKISVNWSNISNQTITVTYENGNGCSGTFSRSITSFSLPTAVLSGSASICPGTSIDLSVILTGKAPWEITYNDGTTSKTISDIASSPYVFSVTPVANAATIYTISNVTDRNNMINAGTGTVVVTVLPEYVAPVIGDLNDLCYGSTNAVIIAIVPGTQSSTVKYQWQSSVDNITWTDLTETGLSYSPGAMYNTTYYRISASVLGCGSKLSNAIKVNVLEPITNAVVSSEQQTICSGDIPVKLTATQPIGGSGVFTYQWQKKTTGDWINVGTDDLNYQPDALTTTTTYRMMAIGSCGSVYSSEVLITVKSVTQPGTLSVDQRLGNGVNPLPIISVTEGSGDGTITYSWEKSVDLGLTWVVIPSATGLGYTPETLLESTWFRRITISTENGVVCTAASVPVKIVLAPTGVDLNGTEQGKLIAYAVRNTEIWVKGEVNRQTIATLYDIGGRIILVKTLEEGSLNIIPTPNIKTGIYLLVVKDKRKLQGFKIPVKE